MMKTSILCLAALAVFTGCASVYVKRTISDKKNGKKLTVRAGGDLLSPDGAAQLIDAARQLVRTELDGKAEERRDVLEGMAEERIASVAAASVEKGEPTTVATRGGEATSGFVGYGPYGGYPYGTGAGYTGNFPGIAPEYVAIEAAGRMGGYLPMLGTPIATAVQTTSAPSVLSGDWAVVACPTDRMPDSLEEQVACNTAATEELLKDRSRRLRHK